MKKLVHLLLLISMSFSVAHAIIIDVIEPKQVHLQEHHHDSSSHHEHEDYASEDFMCNIHPFFHLSFIIPESLSPFEHDTTPCILQSTLIPQYYHYKDRTFRPPIV